MNTISVSNTLTGIQSKLASRDSNSLTFLLVGIILFTFLLFIYRKINLQTSNCDAIRTNWEDHQYSFRNFQNLIDNKYFVSLPLDNSKSDATYKYALKDMYIRTAYNCCCSGRQRNDYMSLCALENCALNGYRALDFTVYGRDSNPIVGSSSSESPYYKESYNYLDFSTVMNKTNSYFVREVFDKSVSSSRIPNLTNDPLFLFLRVKYSQTPLSEKVEKSSSTFGRKSSDDMKITFYNNIYNSLIGNFKESNFNMKQMRAGMLYNNDELRGRIASLKMEDIKNRIFIFVDVGDENMDLLKRSKLDDIVDQYMGNALNSGNLNNTVVVYHENELSENSGKSGSAGSIALSNLVYCIPKSDNYSSSNYDFSNAISTGVQFIGVNVQNRDSYLVYYDDFFMNEAASGSAGVGQSSGQTITPYIKKKDDMIMV